MRIKTTIVIGVLCMAPLCQAQQPSSAEQYSHIWNSPTAMLLSQKWNWIDDRWVGDDTLYRTFRDKTDQQAARRKITAAAIEQYFHASASHPQNSQSLFRWAYAAYASKQEHLAPHVPYPYAWIFNCVPSPHTYNYDRIRFLISAGEQADPHMKDMARRLFKRDPKDYDVEYQLVGCLEPTRSHQERKEAFTYAEDLTHRYPTRANVYSLLGGVYLKLFVAYSDKEDAEKATNAYNRYLQLAPPNAVWRETAERTIQVLQNYHYK